MTRHLMDQQQFRGGIGLREHDLHPATGLRFSSVTYYLNASDDFLVSPQATGTPGLGFLIADTTEWLPVGDSPGFRIPTNSGIEPTFSIGNRFPAPMTLCCRIICTTATFGQRIALRVTGYDQFGVAQREVTPLIEINDPGGSPTPPVTTYFWLSKVFSEVSKIEYMGEGLTGPTVALGIGYRFHPDTSETVLPNTSTFMNYQTGANSEPVFSIYNQGVGMPLLTRPYTSSGVAGIQNEAGVREIVGGTIENLTSGGVAIINPWEPRNLRNRGPVAGMLIGQSDQTAVWEGDTNKFGLFQTQGVLAFRRIDNTPPGQLPSDWNDAYRVTVHARTSIGSGRRPVPDVYPKNVSNRPVSL